jgi:hypothetical protein
MLPAGARHELTSVDPGYESHTLRRTFEPQQQRTERRVCHRQNAQRGIDTFMKRRTGAWMSAVRSAARLMITSISCRSGRRSAAGSARRSPGPAHCGRPPLRQGCVHIQGDAARLTEAQVSIMQRKTKRWPDACASERRRAAPYTRPDKSSASMFLLVRGVHSNVLRSRERRFESCRGHWSEA